MLFAMRYWLLRLFVDLMLSAPCAEFLHFKPVLQLFLILERVVVDMMAHGAFKLC